MTHPVSVIIPAFNEGARLAASIHEVLTYLTQATPDSELILVDDGSTDDTAAIARAAFDQFASLRARVISFDANRGKGMAVRIGLLAAEHRWAIFSDADLSTPITELPKLIDPIAAGECEVAFGSRALDRSLIGRHQPWSREQGGRVMNLIIRTATGMPFWDTQCGFKAFDMRVCRPLIEALQIDRFGFDVEMLYVMQQAGLRLREIPVRWDHMDGSTLSVFRDTRRTLLEIAAVKRHQRRGDYRKAIEAAQEVAKDPEKIHDEPPLANAAS
jgi:dolichyl-phosphate beta-glucosyltransferase